MNKVIFFLVMIFQLTIVAQNNQIIKYNYQDKDGHVCISSNFIVNNESIYRIEDKRKNGVQDDKTADDRFIVVMNDTISKVIYSNKSESIIRIPFYNDEMVYKISSEKNKYIFTGKSKSIDKFNCQEAILKLNGRIYNIWFTPDVEISYGPLKLNGLPGLIIEVFEEKSKIKITLVSLEKLANTNEFEKYKKYIVSKTALEYKKYQEKVVSIMCKNKIKKIANARELGGEIEFNKTHESFTKLLLDIPTNLVSELQKIN